MGTVHQVGIAGSIDKRLRGNRAAAILVFQNDMSDAPIPNDRVDKKGMVENADSGFQQIVVGQFLPGQRIVDREKCFSKGPGISYAAALVKPLIKGS